MLTAAAVEGLMNEKKEITYEFRRLMKWMSKELGHNFTAEELKKVVDLFLEVEGHA